MTQNLNGIDIYECPYFEVVDDRIRFLKGTFYNRTPDMFKTISEINDVTRYCLWIIRQTTSHEVTKYAALVYMGRVQQNAQMIEREFRKILLKKQSKSEGILNESISNPGKTYL